MNVSLIQFDIVWEDKQQNLTLLSSKIRNCKPSGIIVLPEMFSTGFTNNAKEMAESMDGKTVQWMKEHAEQMDSLLIGSIIIIASGNYYNRCISVFPNGTYQFYDKKHLFSYGGEDMVFTSGNKIEIIDYRGWKIKTLICYDLRFPVWSRNQESYDLLIYIASWPEVRISAWKQLLIARAIENQSYVIGVNRVGIDGNNLIYNGHSNVIDYLGNSSVSEDTETIISTNIDKEKLYVYRQTFPAFRDRDLFRFL